jgi:hypothetical protein
VIWTSSEKNGVEKKCILLSVNINKKNAMLCRRVLPCCSLQRNLIVAVEIIDAHNAPITTFFQSKKDLSSGQ